MKCEACERTVETVEPIMPRADKAAVISESNRGYIVLMAKGKIQKAVEQATKTGRYDAWVDPAVPDATVNKELVSWLVSLGYKVDYTNSSFFLEW